MIDGGTYADYLVELPTTLKTGLRTPTFLSGFEMSLHQQHTTSTRYSGFVILHFGYDLVLRSCRRKGPATILHLPTVSTVALQTKYEYLSKSANSINMHVTKYDTFLQEGNRL